MPNTAQVETIMTGLDGGQGFNRLNFTTTDTVDSTILVAAVHAFWDALKTYISHTISFQVQSPVKIVDAATGDLVDIVTATGVAAVVGSDTDNGYVGSAQGLLRLHTSSIVGNRVAQGHLNVPGITIPWMDTGGTLKTAAQTAITASGTAHLQGIADHELAVWSRPRKALGVIVTDGILSPVTSLSTWNQFSVLRSRRD